MINKEEREDIGKQNEKTPRGFHRYPCNPHYIPIAPPLFVVDPHSLLPGTRGGEDEARDDEALARDGGRDVLMGYVTSHAGA